MQIKPPKREIIIPAVEPKYLYESLSPNRFNWTVFW